jgi:hypothetical protein
MVQEIASGVFRVHENRVREKTKFAWRLKGESAVQSPKPKIFYFCFSEIHVSIT